MKMTIAAIAVLLTACGRLLRRKRRNSAARISLRSADAARQITNTAPRSPPRCAPWAARRESTWYYEGLTTDPTQRPKLISTPKSYSKRPPLRHFVSPLKVNRWRNLESIARIRNPDSETRNLPPE